MTNDSESDSFFNNDLPITEVTEDRLERANQADKLAYEILDYLNPQNDKFQKRRKESFVIAILGKWGEGKTSFINLITKKLESENNKTEYSLPQACKISGCRAVANIEILPWDPWYFCTKTDLGQQLYELIRPKCKLLAYEWFVFFILLPFLVALGCFSILNYFGLLTHLAIFLTIFGIAFVVFFI